MKVHSPPPFVADQRKTCRSQRSTFPPSICKASGTEWLSQGLSGREYRRVSFEALQSPKRCVTRWQRVKIRENGSFYRFGLRLKQISSAPTRPSGTWLEPASLALPRLTPPEPIRGPTRILTGFWGLKMCTDPITACRNNMFVRFHGFRLHSTCFQLNKTGHICWFQSRDNENLVALPCKTHIQKYSPPIRHLKCIIILFFPINLCICIRKIKWNNKHQSCILDIPAHLRLVFSKSTNNLNIPQQSGCSLQKVRCFASKDLYEKVEKKGLIYLC